MLILAFKLSDNLVDTVDTIQFCTNVVCKVTQENIMMPKKESTNKILCFDFSKTYTQAVIQAINAIKNIQVARIELAWTCSQNKRAATAPHPENQCLLADLNRHPTG